MFALRHRDWTICHLEVTEILLDHGETYVAGFIKDTKSGIIRVDYYKALYDENWIYVLEVDDIPILVR